MKKQKIEDKLKALRSELDNADAGIKLRFEPILDSLEAEFAQDDDLLIEAEVKYPQMTELINRMADLLSGLGI